MSSSNKKMINTNMIQLEETYSRKSVINSAGKVFQQRLELVKDRFPTADSLMEYFEKLDQTPQKKIVPIMVQWFKQIDILDSYFEALEEHAPFLSEAVKKNIPILTQNYGVTNPYTIKEMSDLFLYFMQVQTDVEEAENRKKQEREQKEKIQKALLYKKDDKVVYKSEDEETNICLGKGTKWCISGTSQNTTWMYKEVKSGVFYIISTNIDKQAEDKRGNIHNVKVKYAYVPTHPWVALLFNINICFDFRNDENEIPEKNEYNGLPLEIFRELNTKIGIPETDFNFKDFANMIQRNDFYEIPHPHEGGYIDIPENKRFEHFFYFLLYAFGGGHANTPWKNFIRPFLNRVPADKQEGSNRYIDWDLTEFYPNVFYPCFMKSFVPAMDATLEGGWERTGKNLGNNLTITYHVVKNILEKFGNKNNPAFWEQVFNGVNQSINDIWRLRKNNAGFIECLNKSGNVVLHTKME